MKICLLNNLYKPYDKGGAEKVVSAMIKQQQALNHEVFLITTKPQKPKLESAQDCPTFYIDSEFYNLGNKSILSRLFWHIHQLYSSKNYKIILNILEKEKPDLVITHNLMGLGFKAAQAIKQAGIKHHHFLHDIQLLHPSGLMIYQQEKIINSWPAKIYQTIANKIIASPELVISPSNWLLNEHKKRNFFAHSQQEIKRLDTILNLKPNTETLLKDQTNEKNLNPKNLLFAGQIEEHKGALFLIQAFLKYAKPDMNLAFAGTGSKLKTAKLLTQNDNRIVFLGRLNSENLKQVMLESDVLIVPSLCYENYPTVIIEAQNTGLKIIASNLGGIPEMMKKEDKLFKAGDPDDMFYQINS